MEAKQKSKRPRGEELSGEEWKLEIGVLRFCLALPDFITGLSFKVFFRLAPVFLEFSYLFVFQRIGVF